MITINYESKVLGTITILVSAREYVGSATEVINVEISNKSYSATIEPFNKGLNLYPDLVFNGKKIPAIKFQGNLYDDILSACNSEKAAKQLEIDAEKARKIDDLKSGKTPLNIKYHDGEYLSGWEAYGESAELLETLGLAKYVDGWGYRLDSKLIDTLGETITYAQAAEYAAPINAAKEVEEKAKRRARAERIIKSAENEVRNADGTLMNERQAKTWKKNYNDINNEGGDGFVPDIITQERYDAALKILAE